MSLMGHLLKKTLKEAKPRLDYLFHNLSICASFSKVSSVAGDGVEAPPVLPPFGYNPKWYNGPLADEVFQKRKKFLGPSLFHYYQKPVSFFYNGRLLNLYTIWIKH